MSTSAHPFATRSVLRALPFVALWLAGLFLMYQNSFVFDYQTITRDIDPFVSISRGLPYLTVEVIALYLILRPNSFRRSWGRALTAFVVFAGWTTHVIQYVVHSPGWYLSHAWWLMAVTVGLFILVVVSVVARLRGRKVRLA